MNLLEHVQGYLKFFNCININSRLSVCIDTFQISILSIDRQNRDAYVLYSFHKLPYDSFRMIPTLNSFYIILFYVYKTILFYLQLIQFYICHKVNHLMYWD